MKDDLQKEFEEIFESTIDLNTLDYQLYRECQQKLIDVLDQAEYIRVRGMGQNTTNIKVALHKLKDPVKESNFENCVADVNIPVGEVFTSPELKGTDGIFMIPCLAMQTLIKGVADIQLNQEITVRSANIDIPTQAIDFIKI